MRHRTKRLKLPDHTIVLSCVLANRTSNTLTKASYKRHKGTETNLEWSKQSQIIKKDVWSAKNNI